MSNKLINICHLFNMTGNLPARCIMCPDAFPQDLSIKGHDDMK
jgi:hypothetical protein